MICTLFLKSRQEKGQTWTNTVYRGDMYALYRMADAQHAAVLFAAVHRELPQAFDRGGRTQAPSAQPSGGSGCKECADRTKPASGGAHYEEVLMRKETSSGGRLVRFYPLIIAIM